ncbi:glycosyltransferase [Agromyces sp. NPDC057679]|uniref:glycosyltransferase n=1 Tax=Agromyces sp. NPDC057679 TaxID=3346207 RepID=UPI00367169EE
MLKVSVVVATYSPGTGLDRLVASLDAQTLAADDFEVIFVDDGSPDDTLDRLKSIQATRPNVRVERIENSGWASRPRNIGADLAVGEYLLFMDHDDELYPDALRAASAFAREHHADVLNGKESRTHDAGWALDTYSGDRGQDRGRVDAHPLVPTNPHKLYRTAFVREHGIRFPEGRRVLWEDIFFNVEVAEHAATISTLSSVPFYHWVQTAGSGSTTFKRSDPVWWDYLSQVIDSIERHLGHDSLQGAQLRRHQYRSRLLASFNPAYGRRPLAERELIETRARELQDQFMDATDDESLDRGALAVARALRSGDSALLALVSTTNGTDRFAEAQLGSASWSDGKLLISTAMSTVERHAGGGTFLLDGTRVLAIPGATIARLGTIDEFDVRAELDSTTASLVVRGRSSRIAWDTGGNVTSQSLVSTAEGTEATFGLELEGAVDVRSDAFGAPLDSQVWDVFERVNRAGRVQQPRVRASIAALPALIDGRPVTAYANRDGFLSIDVGGEITSVFDGATPSAVVGSEPGAANTTVVLALPGLPVSGSGEGEGWVALSERGSGLRARLARTVRKVIRRSHPPARFPVRYLPSESGATARIELPSRPGRYRWRPSERSPGLPGWDVILRGDDVRLEVHHG